MAASKQPRITYTPSQIEHMSARNIRQSLSRLRSMAQKRQARLRAAGYEDTDLATRPLPTVRSLTPEDQAAELADLSRLLRDPRSTIKGARLWETHMRQALQKSHYENVSSGDLKKFGKYMEEMRDRYIGKIYGSDPPAALYNAAAAVGISGATIMRNFKKYLENEQSILRLKSVLEAQELPEGRKRMSSNELRVLLGEEVKKKEKKKEKKTGKRKRAKK